MMDGSPERNADVQIRKGNDWLKLDVRRVLYPKSSDVDIAVLETTFPVSQPYSVQVESGKANMTFGQPVWFLGYPFSGRSRDEISERGGDNRPVHKKRNSLGD